MFVKQVPNGVGSVLGIVQLALYTYYSRFSGEESTEPLLVSYAWKGFGVQEC